MTNRKNRLEWRLRALRNWIEDHGGDVAGYVDRYGSPGDPKCHGNGGEAIYRADVEELHKIRDQLARFNIVARQADVVDGYDRDDLGESPDY